MGCDDERNACRNKKRSAPDHRTTLQLSVIAPGVIEAVVLLQTLKFTLLEVGYTMTESIPLVDGMYPVTPVGSPLKEARTASVESALVAVAVTALAHEPELIELVPSAVEPLAMVDVTPPVELNALASAAVTFEPNPIMAVESGMPVRFVPTPDDGVPSAPP